MITLNPFGPKAHRFITRPMAHDARINILSGAIRSSKTVSMIPKVFAACRYPVGGAKLISGQTKATIQRNVLNDLFDIAGAGNWTYNINSGEMTLFGTKFLIIGAKDVGSEKLIRGATFGFAYCDEVSLMPESFWLMLVGRMSPPGARLYGTTNPGPPTNFLYKDFMTDPVKLESGDVWTETWTLDDNPSLDLEWVASIKRNYKGTYFQRLILGKWCMAEGAIFKDCLSDANYYSDVDEPIGLKNEGGSQERIIAVDYGTANPCVFLNIQDDGRNYWVTDELRWDSKKRERQKSDDEYADDLEEFIGPRRNALVIVDPSALSFKVVLTQRGIPWMDAQNDVWNGIMFTSSVLGRDMIRINKDKCPELIAELQSYAWDSKKLERGVEEPIKFADHGCDSLRYGVFTRFPQWRLEPMAWAA